jgi:hypothetical protein
MKSATAAAVRMDPHVSTHSVEPPDLGPFHLYAGCPPLIDAPGLPELDQGRGIAQIPGKLTSKPGSAK